MVAYALLGLGSLFEGFLEEEKAKAEVMRWRMMSEYYRMIMTKAHWDMDTHTFNGGFGDQGLVKKGMWEEFRRDPLGLRGGTAGSRAAYAATGAGAGDVTDKSTLAFLTERGPGLNANLDANFAPRLQAAVAEAEAATGAKAQFASYRRTEAQQASIRAEHEAMPGGVAAHPAAAPGQSKHQYGDASDMKDGPVLRYLHEHPEVLNKHGLEFLPGRAGANDPGHIQLQGPPTGRYTQADTQTPYQVAGPMEALSEEGARRSAADLAAHRAAAFPAEQHKVITDPDVARAWPGPPIQTTPPRTPTPIPGSQQGPESPQAPRDIPPTYLSPSDMPSSGVAASVYDPRLGPPQRTGAPPNVGPTPSTVPDQYGPPQRTGAPPDVGMTPSSVPAPVGGEYFSPMGAGPPQYAPAVPPPRPKDLATGGKEKGKEADKPSKKAKEVSAEKPTGIPKGPTIDSQQRPYAMAEPGQRAIGTARSPLNYDPYWRPNPPTAERKGPTQPNTGMPTPTKTTIPSTATANVPPTQPPSGPPRTITPPTAGPQYVVHRPPSPTPPTAGPEYANQPPPSTGGGGGGMSLEDMQNQLAMLERMDAGSGSSGGGSNPALSMPNDQMPIAQVNIPQNVDTMVAGGAQPGGGSAYGQAPPSNINIPTWQRDQDVGDIIYSRKGGPIQKFNRGGIPSRPVLKFQGGGAASSMNMNTTYGSPMYPGPGGTTYSAPNYSGGTPANVVPNYANQAMQYAGGLSGMPYSADMLTGLQGNAGAQNVAFQADWGAMTPDQQATYNQIYRTGQMPTPPAATPAPAPAPTPTPAPTPPPANTTTQTTATDPYLNSITNQNATVQAQLTNDLANQTATSTAAATAANAPSVIKNPMPQPTTPTTPSTSTPTGTNYSGTTGTGTTGATGSNYASTGDIATTTEKTTSPLAKSYAGFDDGGDVGPSVIGPPPALGSAMGQQTPIPPYYYNPYTYAPSAAPVGKGVTTTSVGTVMPSAAVPTYQAGGDVSTTDSQQGGYDPVIASDMYGQGAGYPGPIGPYYNVQPPSSGGSPGITSRGGISMRGMGMGGGGGQRGFAGLDIPMPPEFGPGGEYEKPEGAPPYASSIADHNGHPSPDIIHAIQDGVGTLMKMFGLQPGGNQGMPNQQQVQGQQAFRDARSGITPQQMEDYHNIIDPEHQLDYSMRYLAGLGTIYKYYMMQGETETAGRVAAGMLLYSRELAQNYGEQALQHWYRGDAQGAAELEAMGFSAIPNGVKYDVKNQPNSDGTLTVGAFGLTNQKLWEEHVAPMMIVAGAMGLRDGVAYWRGLQSVAEKYSPQERLELAQSLKHEQDTEGVAGAEPYIAGIAGGPRGNAPTTDSQPSGLPPKTNITWPSVQSSAPAQPQRGAPPAGVVPRAQPVTGPPQPGTLAAPATPPATEQSGLPPPNQMAGDINPAEALPTQQGAPPAGAGQGTSQASPPPPAADARGGVFGRTSPAYQGLAGQQDVTPEQEMDYYSRTREIAHSQNFTPQGDPIIGGQPMYRPNEPDWVRIPKQYLPQVRQYYNDQLRRYEDARNEANMNEQRMYESHHADIAGQVATQRQRVSQAQTDYRQMVGKRYDAAKTMEHEQFVQGQKLLQDALNRGHEDRVRQETATVAAEKPLQWTDSYKEDIAGGTKISVREAARDAVVGGKDPSGADIQPLISSEPTGKDYATGEFWVPKGDQSTVVQMVGDIYRFSQGRIDIPDAARMVKAMVSAPYYAKPFTATYDPKDTRVHVSVTDGRNIHTFVVSDEAYRDMDKLAHDMREASMGRQVSQLHEAATGGRATQAGEKAVSGVDFSGSSGLPLPSTMQPPSAPIRQPSSPAPGWLDWIGKHMFTEDQPPSPPGR